MPSIITGLTVRTSRPRSPNSDMELEIEREVHGDGNRSISDTSQKTWRTNASRRSSAHKPSHLLQFIASKSKAWKKLIMAIPLNALAPPDPLTICHVLCIECTGDSSTKIALPSQRIATDQVFTISTMIVFGIAASLFPASLDLIIRCLKRGRNHAL